MRTARTLALLCLAGTSLGLVYACDSSESTDRSSAETSGFLLAVANDSRVSISKIDYRAIDDEDLNAAGEAICAQLARAGRTADGQDLERAEEAIVTRFDLGRAVATPGAEQDPGVPLRNADLRLASAIGRAALEHLCPDQPFDSAR